MITVGESLEHVVVRLDNLVMELPKTLSLRLDKFEGEYSISLGIHPRYTSAIERDARDYYTHAKAVIEQGQARLRVDDYGHLELLFSEQQK